LVPYLRRIDAGQWYTNFGALVMSFEERLADHFGVKRNEIVTVANGTLGLIAALQAHFVSPGEFCVMPSFTFPATPVAAMAAGLQPYFVDVNRETWALDAGTVAGEIARIPGKVAAVMPVSPFGAPVDAAEWDSFALRTGIKVVLDAAAAFDSLRPGTTPAMVSLHATKAFGIGEGGLVISRAPEFTDRVRRLSNFGFSRHYGVEAAGGNYKLSEYAAAVGHAALDLWPATRDATRDVAAVYRQALQDVPGLRVPSWFGQHAGAYCVVELADPIGSNVVRELESLAIETRLWWGRPCHHHPAFANCKHSSLPNTEWLVSRVLNLPFFPDLDVADVLRVRDALYAILATERGSQTTPGRTNHHQRLGCG